MKNWNPSPVSCQIISQISPTIQAQKKNKKKTDLQIPVIDQIMVVGVLTELNEGLWIQAEARDELKTIMRGIDVELLPFNVQMPDRHRNAPTKTETKVRRRICCKKTPSNSRCIPIPYNILAQSLMYPKRKFIKNRQEGNRQASGIRPDNI